MDSNTAFTIIVLAIICYYAFTAWLTYKRGK